MYTHEVVHLNITSWVGTMAMGEHWYGNLHFYLPEYEKTRWGLRKRHEVDVTYTLGKAEAARLNEDDPDWHGYRVGDESSRFFLRDRLLEEALKCWKEHVPHGKVLLCGDPVELGVHEVLVGPANLKRLGNQLWQADKAEGYEMNTRSLIRYWTDKRESIDAQWQALFKKHGLLDLTDR